MEEQLLTTYSFFAALTENSTDIYSAVYIPICKRALSLYSKKKTIGTDQDIRNIISSEYGIDVPLLIVRKLIKSVGRNLSRRDRAKFDFHIEEQGNSFLFLSNPLLLVILKIRMKRNGANQMHCNKHLKYLQKDKEKTLINCLLFRILSIRTKINYRHFYQEK
mgnify:CR=1 FL=1